MTKNPALLVLTIVAIAGAVAALLLIALANAGVGRTYDFNSGLMVGGVQPWAALIPAAVAILAGIGALLLWGLARPRSR